MEENREKTLLKKKRAYKRAKVLTGIFAVLFAFIIVAGIMVGLYSSEKAKEILEDYRTTSEFKEIKTQDLNKLKTQYRNGEITKEEFFKKNNYIDSSKSSYVEENLARSDSELKKQSEKNDNLLVEGIAMAVAGAIGVIGSGVVSAKKSEKYLEETEKQN